MLWIERVDDASTSAIAEPANAWPNNRTTIAQCACARIRRPEVFRTLVISTAEEFNFPIVNLHEQIHNHRTAGSKSLWDRGLQ